MVGFPCQGVLSREAGREGGTETGEEGGRKGAGREAGREGGGRLGPSGSDSLLQRLHGLSCLGCGKGLETEGGVGLGLDRCPSPPVLEPGAEERDSGHLPCHGQF